MQNKTRHMCRSMLCQKKRKFVFLLNLSAYLLLATSIQTFQVFQLLLFQLGALPVCKKKQMEINSV